MEPEEYAKTLGEVLDKFYEISARLKVLEIYAEDGGFDSRNLITISPKSLEILITGIEESLDNTVNGRHNLSRLIYMNLASSVHEKLCLMEPSETERNLEIVAKYSFLAARAYHKVETEFFKRTGDNQRK